MALEVDVGLRDVKRLAGSDADLRAHDVDARDFFRDAVLDLDTRVDLHEVELVVLEVQEELDRADVGVVDALGGLDGQRADLLAHLVRQRDRRRLLEELLVAALDGALALAEVDDLAVVVGDNLDFDVARTLDVVLEVVVDLLEVDECVEDVLELVLIVCDIHALAAAAGNRLEDDGVADFLGHLDGLFVVLERLAALGHRDAGRLHGGAGDILVADEADRLRHRSDPGDAVLGDLLGEVCILREEAVARVDGVSARLERCAQDRVLV